MTMTVLQAGEGSRAAGHLTPDIGGPLTTAGMTRAIVQQIG